MILQYTDFKAHGIVKKIIFNFLQTKLNFLYIFILQEYLLIIFSATEIFGNQFNLKFRELRFTIHNLKLCLHTEKNVS